MPEPQIHSEVIIGSGPTAWACAEGLWSRGRTPTIIDIGYTSQRQSGLDMSAGSTVSVKRLFGNKHMYHYPVKLLGMEVGHPVTPTSGALGGFSTVWGAGIQPVSTHDLFGFPTSTAREMLMASTALLSKMRFLGAHDSLSLRDPWPIDPQGVVAYSPRFRAIHERANRNSKSRRSGTVFGSPRLAITGPAPESADSCILCGQCMTGCSTNSIFDSGRELMRGLSRNGGSYIEGCVTSLQMNDMTDGSRVVGIDVTDAFGNMNRLFASEVFLAAGPIGTAILILKSRLLEGSLKVKDSQMFYAGFLCLDSYVAPDKWMSTSQGYFSTDHTVDSVDEFSCSVYEYSQEFETRLFELAPTIMKPTLRVVKPVLKRLVPGIGFVSPERSGHFQVELRDRSILVTAERNITTDQAVKSARRRLARASKNVGLIHLPSPFLTPAVGAGFHIGSSLPMGHDSQSGTQWDGSLKRSPQIKIVDASSLPRIRAGSHTFLAMANAFRIASMR